MAAIHEELHRLIDGLSEQEAEQLARQLRQQLDYTDRTAWLAQARQLHDKLKAKHGQVPSAVDLLDEVREERLNDLMQTCNDSVGK